MDKEAEFEAMQAEYNAKNDRIQDEQTAQILSGLLSSVYQRNRAPQETENEIVSQVLAKMHPATKQETCSICRDDDDEANYELSSCNHGFHKSCIEGWIKTKWREDNGNKDRLTCPICRGKMLSS